MSREKRIEEAARVLIIAWEACPLDPDTQEGLLMDLRDALAQPATGGDGAIILRVNDEDRARLLAALKDWNPRIEVMPATGGDECDRCNRLTRLAACLASAVKSGEEWTDTLEREYRAAVAPCLPWPSPPPAPPPDAGKEET